MELAAPCVRVAGRVTPSSSSLPVMSSPVAVALVVAVASASTVAPSTMPPVEATSGRLCAAPPINAVAGGCLANAACVPIARNYYARCVKVDGAVDKCPSTYTRHYDAADSVKDDRKCTDCRCESTATCDKQALAVYGDADCSGDKMTFSATGVCSATGAPSSGVKFKSYRYAAEVKDEKCLPAGGGDAIGAMSLVHETTICCL